MSSEGIEDKRWFCHKPICYTTAMVTIERATVDEVHDAKRVLKEVWIDTYSNVYSGEQIDYITSIWHDPDRLKQEIQNPDYFFAVVKEGNTIVGVFTARIQLDGVVDISRLYIKKEYQGQGIGSQFITEVQTAFPHAKKLRLEVEEQNHKALKFYEKHGFKEVGRKKEKIQNETMDSVVMEKDL